MAHFCAIGWVGEFIRSMQGGEEGHPVLSVPSMSLWTSDDLPPFLSAICRQAYGKVVKGCRTTTSCVFISFSSSINHFENQCVEGDLDFFTVSFEDLSVHFSEESRLCWIPTKEPCTGRSWRGTFETCPLWIRFPLSSILLDQNSYLSCCPMHTPDN